MNQTISQNRVTPRSILRGIVAWCAAAFLFLLVSAALITLADLKSSSFPYFSFATLVTAAFFAARNVKQNTSVPVWLLALSCSLALTILLLSVGFMIAGSSLRTGSILTVAAGNLIGCLLGAASAKPLKRLQKERRKRQRKR